MKAVNTIQKIVMPCILLACLSCAVQKEMISPPVALKEPLPEMPAPTPVPAPAPTPVPVPQPPRFKTVLKCQDDTQLFFNSCGIDSLPFVRPSFFDIDNDGTEEMIAGTKNGSLNLYKNFGTVESPQWKIVEGYFDGVKAGAFSSPAAGDIDNDGVAELALGTGGFSSESGKVIFYKNFGMPSRPLWRKIKTAEIDVGNDATPALYDMDRDGRPDLIVGNSTGGLVLFRNRTEHGRVLFTEDPGYFRGIQIGLYTVPTVTSSGNRTFVIAGDDRGRLQILTQQPGKRASWTRDTLSISLSSFAAPAFISGSEPNRKDLVVSDGSGQLFYFRNKKGNFREWEEVPAFFSGRITPGPACTPAIAEIHSRSYMVVGNISGEIKLFEYLPSSKGLPWKEKPGFFRNIKLPGFARGVLADWQTRQLLITGDQDGTLRAFLNTGTLEKPAWIEQKRFFGSIQGSMHAAPSVFDLDGDGRWELIVGDVDGNVSGYAYETGKDGMPVWRKLGETFRGVRVDGYAAPVIFRDTDRLYLLSGQQDGRVHVFIAEARDRGFPVFRTDEYLRGIRVENHSSPAVIMKDGLVELSIGDYNGNLKHFACEKTSEEVKEN